MQIRNLIILTACQLISATGSIVMVTLGGLVGAELTGNPAFATLPISLMVVAVAATTVPASLLMQRIGRARGFAFGSLCAAAGAAIAAVALRQASFELFIVAAVLIGVNMAFTQQYRYAAAESVAARYVPRAISLVLLGAIGGAFIGPELVTRGQQFVFDIPYAGTMIALVGFYLLQAALFVFGLRVTVQADRDGVEKTDRNLAGIVLQCWAQRSAMAS